MRRFWVVFAVACALMMGLQIIPAGAVEMNDSQALELVKTPVAKRALAREAGVDVHPDTVIFDPDSGALDIFGPASFCYSIDFLDDESGVEGVASFLYEMQGPVPALVDVGVMPITTWVAGNISADETWTSEGSPYYVHGYTSIDTGVTLNVEPGTIVMFRKLSGQDKFSLGVNGNLTAQGAPDQPVIFTSSCPLENQDAYYDDDFRDWYGIEASYGDGVVTLDTCVVEYAYHAISSSDNGNLSITGCLLRRNVYGVYAYTNDPVTCLIQGNRIEDFVYRGIYLGDYTYGEADYRIIGNILQGGTDYQPYLAIDLYLGAPKVLKNTIRGASTGIEGYYLLPDALVRGNDISVTGEGIRCYYGSGQVTANTIAPPPDYSGYTGVNSYYSDLQVTKNTINGFSYGIRCYGYNQDTGGSPDISQNDIHDSYNYGIYCSSGATPAIHLNNITNNSYGVYNSDSTVQVDATNNWWGDSSGPYHSGTNPDGQGDQVSDYVDFDPWLTSPGGGMTAPQVAAAFSLGDNYPNPFNPETWFPYSLAEATDVTIRIHNAAGQLVRTLDLGRQSEGHYFSQESAAYWDGRNDTGERVSSGVYFYTLESDKFTATRKMILAK